MAHAYLSGGDGVTVVQRCAKVSFSSRRQAAIALKQMDNECATKFLVAAGRGKMGVYRCPICRAWHLGHQSDAKKRGKSSGEVR